MSNELNLPKAYVEMSEDDMMYVDGGWKIRRSWVAAGLDVMILAIAPALAPIKWMGNTAAKSLVKRYLPKLAGWIKKAVSAVIGVSLNVSVGTLGNIIFKNAWCLTSAGGIASLAADYFSDKRVDGWIRF